MHKEHTTQRITAPPLQVKANSLFRKILPPSPFVSRFWRYTPHIATSQPIENRDFGPNESKKRMRYTRGSSRRSRLASKAPLTPVLATLSGVN
jgi:hypothetical protein